MTPEPEGQAALRNTISTMLTTAVREQVVTGLYVMTADRDGITYSGGAGTRDGTTPWTDDTIAWLASMTKPIVAVASLQLVERGLIELDTPTTDQRWRRTETSAPQHRRLAVTAGLTLMIVAAMVGLTAPAASAKSGDWGHTPGTSLYGCTNPSVCNTGARAVREGWIQVWCWQDSYWQKWFKVRAWTGNAWNEGWVPTVRVDRQPSVPRCP